jgi:hypothetical protein
VFTLGGGTTRGILLQPMATSIAIQGENVGDLEKQTVLDVIPAIEPDIEHVLVKDDPRQWSPRRKVCVPLSRRSLH